MVLNEKVKCPECNKTMTKHCLEYTHKCRAKANTQLVIEDVKPTEPTSTQSIINEAKHDLREVNVEDIVHNYLLEGKHQQINTKRLRAKSLLQGKLP